MASTMASTARPMAGISRATASATWRSSALMISRMRAVGSASMPSDAGLTCSVSRSASGVSGNSGLPHHAARCFEGQPCALFGLHFFQAAAEDFHAESVRVADLLERAQESYQIDHALAAHQ